MSANNGQSRELEVRFWAWVQTLAMDHDATLDKAIRMSRRLQNTATVWMMWACWVSSKRTQGVVTKRGHGQMHSRVRSGTLIVTHENSTRHPRTWHFYKYTWQQLFDGREMGAPSIPAHILGSDIPLSLALKYHLVIWLQGEATNLDPSTPEILHPHRSILHALSRPMFPQSFSFVCTMTLKTECS